MVSPLTTLKQLHSFFKIVEVAKPELIMEYMPFHGCDSITLKIGRPLTSEGLYLCLMMSCHPPELESPRLHSHSNNIALFFPCKEPTPRPLLAFSLTTTFQDTLWIFLASETPTHKNLRWIKDIICATTLIWH